MALPQLNLRRPRREMQQLEPLDGRRCSTSERLLSGFKSAPGKRSARSLGKYVGASHGAQISNQSLEFRVSDLDTVDIDDRLYEANGCQQRGQRRAVNARVEMRCRASRQAIGGEHCNSQPGQAVAADDCTNEQPARAKRLPKCEGRSLHVIARFQSANRQT